MSLDNRKSILAMVAVAILMCAALFGAIAVATSSNHTSDTHHNYSDRYSDFADMYSSSTTKVKKVVKTYVSEDAIDASETMVKEEAKVSEAIQAMEEDSWIGFPNEETSAMEENGVPTDDVYETAIAEQDEIQNVKDDMTSMQGKLEGVSFTLSEEGPRAAS